MLVAPTREHIRRQKKVVLKKIFTAGVAIVLEEEKTKWNTGWRDLYWESRGQVKVVLRGGKQHSRPDRNKRTS